MDHPKMRAAIGARPWRSLLEQALPDLSFEDVRPIHRAFAPMARRQDFDVSEMAIVTALQAVAYDKPIVVLPVTLASRFQQGCLVARRATPLLSIGDLRGKRIAVRAYTQTTGVWVRGILENDENVAASDIAWVTQEEAHVAEYEDPPWVRRVAEHKSLLSLLHEGEAEAAVFGNDLPDDPDLVTLYPDPKRAAHEWYAKHGVVPVNHVIVVRNDLPAETVRALWQTLRRLRPVQTGPIDMAPLGIEPLRPCLELLLRYCDQQRLLPRALTVDAVFADALRILGDDARQ
jgi:4,5-dihydroxyphthalate decarboxylase